MGGDIFWVDIYNNKIQHGFSGTIMTTIDSSNNYFLAIHNANISDNQSNRQQDGIQESH